MESPVVVIGIGEMGSVFARGLLRTGHPVYPVTRDTDLAVTAKLLPSPERVLVAVAENDLHAVLEHMPAAWHSRLALLQNELLPGDWQQYGYTVSELWASHRELAEAVAHEVIQLQEAQTEQHFQADAIIAAMLKAFAGDPGHRCMGRSAPARLARALQQADAAGLAIPRLREIASRQQ